MRICPEAGWSGGQQSNWKIKMNKYDSKESKDDALIVKEHLK